MRPMVSLAALMLALVGPAVAQQATFDFPMHAAPLDLPDLVVTGTDGTPYTLGDPPQGHVLLNVWATWCAPCREELPDLDALQRDIGGPGFRVIALSTDTGRRPAVERLLAEVGAETLDPVIDDTGAAMRDLGIFALPTTLLIDGSGQEIGRKIGPAQWNSPEAVAFFEALPGF